MQFLLNMSGLIDRVTERAGKLLTWLVLAAVLISALNAIVRKVFSVGSNAFLEVQWYLFAAVFLMTAGYTLLRNEHVRIDVLSGRLSKRGQAWIDIIGLTAFLLPISLLMVYLSWPQFMNAYVSGEMSSNAGGLIRWPAKLLIPVGFSMLIIQAISELIKRFAFLQGLISDPTSKLQEKTPEEQLAEAIKAAADQAARDAAAGPDGQPVPTRG
jgi:TRAP-type mannitol/chloroaromatic compound transport system permease small subunit